MIDPHVVSLLYRIEHDASVDYSEAETVEDGQSEFDVRVENDEAEFTMKLHCASVEEARAIVEPYVRCWEFETSLQRGPNTFNLGFVRPHIVDRNPPPDVISARAHVEFGPIVATASLTARTPYPPPPSANIVITPDVSSMHQRYLGYREGREPLPAMAYFCLTVVEDSTGPKKGKRPRAAAKYGVAYEVLDKIGDLSAKGGSEARKAVGMHKQLASKERTFLDAD